MRNPCVGVRSSREDTRAKTRKGEPSASPLPRARATVRTMKIRREHRGRREPEVLNREPQHATTSHGESTAADGGRLVQNDDKTRNTFRSPPLFLRATGGRGGRGRRVRPIGQVTRGRRGANVSHRIIAAQAFLPTRRASHRTVRTVHSPPDPSVTHSFMIHFRSSSIFTSFPVRLRLWRAAHTRSTAARRQMIRNRHGRKN